MELIIVIGILAILSTVVVLVLNPAEMLAQARDSTRISDLNSVKSAIGLYLATATSPAITSGSRSNVVAGCWFGAACTSTCVVNATTTVDGAGWVAVDLRSTSGGSPLAALPLDPRHPDTTFQYAFRGVSSTLTFELNGNLESTKHSGLRATDGGNCATIYEVGTDLSL